MTRAVEETAEASAARRRRAAEPRRPDGLAGHPRARRLVGPARRDLAAGLVDAGALAAGDDAVHAAARLRAEVTVRDRRLERATSSTPTSATPTSSRCGATSGSTSARCPTATPPSSTPCSPARSCGSPPSSPAACTRSTTSWPELVVFGSLTALLLALCGLVVTAATAQTARGRPYDAAIFALSPLLVFHAFSNWDLLAMAFARLRAVGVVATKTGAGRGDDRARHRGEAVSGVPARRDRGSWRSAPASSPTRCGRRRAPAWCGWRSTCRSRWRTTTAGGSSTSSASERRDRALDVLGDGPHPRRRLASARRTRRTGCRRAPRSRSR